MVIYYLVRRCLRVGEMNVCKEILRKTIWERMQLSSDYLGHNQNYPVSKRFCFPLMISDGLVLKRHTNGDVMKYLNMEVG